MKHLLLSLASVALLSSPATAQLHSTAGKAPVGHSDAARMEISRNFKTLATPLSRAAETVTVKPVVGGGISLVMATAVVDGKVVSYGAQTEEGKEFSFELPAGTYDMLGFGYNDDLSCAYLVYQGGVDLAEGSAPVFNSADATSRIDFKLMSPKGKELMMPSDDGSVEGNCCIGDALNMISYNGELVLYADVTLFGDGQRYLMTNFTECNYGFTRLQSMASQEGFLQMVIPVDFSKSVATNDVSQWQVASLDFAKTPKQLFWDNLMIEMGADPETDTYNFGQFGITYNGATFGIGGLGMDGNKYTAATVGVNRPAGYAGPYDYILFPMGAAIAGDNSTIIGMPLRGSSEGLVQLGLNPLSSTDFMYSVEDQTFGNGNPNLPTAVPTARLANCTPTLTVFPDFIPANFGYTGRHGEALTIDSWYMPDNIDPEGLDMVGPATNIVNVYWGDQSLGDFRENVDWDLGGDNDYRVDYFTGNVSIDGNIGGHNHGILTFNSETYGKKLPTVTLLQVFDNEGNQTDRLTDPEGASLGLYATTLEFTVVDIDPLYIYSKPASVKIEYAPYTCPDFKELTVVADPSKDWTPGWGSYYTAQLSGVNDPAPYGWYDLRITVTSEEGASLQQIVSPAFNITAFTGIETVENTDAEAPVVYYNLQGQRVDNPAAGQIVIRRQGTKATKIIL